MPTFPHDVTDLALAPVVLAVDTQLESFSAMDQEEIAMRIALETNRQPRNLGQRRDALMETVLRFIDMHGWQVAWSDRGLRLMNDLHTVTLGLPASLRTYLT